MENRPDEIGDLLAYLAEREQTLGVPAYWPPPENLLAFPAFVNYPWVGEDERSGDASRQLYTLIVELHVARGMLPAAAALAEPFIRRFTRLVLDDVTLGGRVICVSMVRHRFGALLYGGDTTTGIRFDVLFTARWLL